jgi:hypothetical protein
MSSFERVIRYDPLPSQLKFHLAQARFKGFSGPVGSGKSAALVNECLRLAYVNGGCPGIVAAPTYRMLADVTRSAFLEILDESEVPYEFEKSANVVYLPEPESTIRFRSLDNPQRLVGHNIAWFGVDELTYSKEEAWKRLLARLRHPKATERVGVASWTPKGFDWVWKRFISPDRIAGYEAVLARPRENKHLPDDFYEDLKASYDERFYQQEAEGLYLNVFSGQAYYTFDRAESVKPIAFDPRFPLCWALDFNVDPMASVIAQVIDTTTHREMINGKRSQVIVVLDELVLPDSRTPEAVKAFMQRIKPFQQQGLQAIQVYGDASGTARRSSALRTDWQIVREELRDLGVPIYFRVPAKNPEVRERVTEVCGALRSTHGERRLFVDPKCKELIMDFEMVPWKRDSSGNSLSDLDKSDKHRTHVSDALGYLVHRERRSDAGPRSTPLF